MVWDEVSLARRRMNSILATEALLMQLVVGSVMSDDSGKALKKAIEELTRG